jgi:transposase
MASEHDRLAAKFSVIFPHLDERQRRLLMGAEARVLGRGGIRVVARAAGVGERTVSTGVAELEAGAEPLGRVRRPGGGRKPVTQTDPELLPALMALVEPEERGDPMSPLRWTTKSLRTLAAELTRQGHRVSPGIVAQVLHREGFSLQANAKTLEGQRHPDRDGQFSYLNDQVKAHQDSGDPVVSVDSKKKEQVGEYANAGRTWRPKGEPVPVRSHDFPDPDTAVAIPYGIYDLSADTGWVNVGTDHNTAAFAVASIGHWWDDTGRHDYPTARRLLITADAGGSNGYRTRAWKTELAALAARTGLEITVCHFPPGTSKWNKIEHRLFSHITTNWRGRPLTSHQVIIESIAATTTSTGLRVHAELDPAHYDLGTKISDAELAALPLTSHDWHGDWNYTLHPAPTSTEPAPDPSPSRRDPASLTWLAHPTLTGIPTEEWGYLVAVLTTMENDEPRSPRGAKPVLPMTARLAATLVNHHTRLPRSVLAQMFGVFHTALHVNQILGYLQRINRLPRRGGYRLANLKDLYDIVELEGIPTEGTPASSHARATPDSPASN